MSATVTATCPGCRHLLKIPIDWADRQLKCKKCGTVVQARKKAAGSQSDTGTAPALTGSGTPPMIPPPQAAPSQAIPYTVYPGQPGYDPRLPYAAPPVAATPQGYPQPQAYPQPQPYGMPQAYAPPGYPQPQAAYPYAQPPAYAVPEPAAFVPEDSYTPTTRRKAYRKGGSSKWVGALVVLVICGGLVGGGFYMLKQIEKEKQAKADGEGDGTTTDGARPGGANTKAGSSTLAKLSDPFPRRLLFINASRYVYCNSLSVGSSGRGDDMPSRTASKLAFELRVPTDKENNQVFLLSDSSSGKEFRVPVKSVIQQSYEQFFKTSRPQDRIVIYFGGHATAIDGKAYLVPVEGEIDDAESLIPLDDFYAKLRECPAQQKVVLFDVCRFNPQSGATKPGSDPMSEELFNLMSAAPAGVQVVMSCSAKEQAIESLEIGSEFLRGLRLISENSRVMKAPPAAASDPIPVDNWAAFLREKLAVPRDGTPPQSVKLLGTPTGTAVAYNKDEPAAARFEWPTLEKTVSAADVNEMIQVAATLPGIRKDLDIPPALGEIYPFSAEAMKAYGSDGITDEMILKNGEKYPLRKATLEALTAIREKWTEATSGDNGGIVRETFEGAADDKVKKQIVSEQEPLARLSFGVFEQLQKLQDVEPMLKDEKSKRWQALFQYALAQTQMRWAYLEEYNLSLGNIRTDNIEKPKGDGVPVWRLTSVSKMKSKKDPKEAADSAKTLFEEMAETHKGTPWEVLAKMHKNVALGLEWKLVVAEKPEDDKKDMMPEMKKE